MAMAWVWAGMVVLSLIFGLATGNLENVSNAAMEGANSAVELSVSMAGVMCLWSGVMEIMNACGLSQGLSRAFRPILRRLMPEASRDPETLAAVTANVSANLLGLGNAATPMGIRAACRMARGTEGVASDELCRLVVLNTASIQLLPTTVASVRAACGSAAPLDILPAVWVSSLLSVTAGLAAAKLLVGAFSLVVLSGDGKLVALRDPNGYRPLCIGENEYGMAVASESCALDSCGFRFVRDIQPGEAVLIENGRIRHCELYAAAPRRSLCVFEYVYFARPDSVIDGVSVYEARLNMGRMLAREHPVEADLVCGVPNSGLEAAMGYARESGIRYGLAFVKNSYIGRSFIFPTQAQRENAVRLKLNPLAASVRGKRIVLVDDSIVRGTTCRKTIASLRNAGAKEIHMRISSPPFIHTCYFGTDIGSEKNLIANQQSVAEICRSIGADSLGYISVDGLMEACAGCGVELCAGCFTGDYATKICCGASA